MRGEALRMKEHGDMMGQGSMLEDPTARLIRGHGSTAEHPAVVPL